MGIQDRDYYRNEGPSVFESLVPSGMVCRWLIGINIGVFFLQMVALTTTPMEMDAVGQPRSLGWVTDWFILDPTKVMEGQVWRLLTYAFLHSVGSVFFLHLIFNMLFLWWFGSDMETLYGSKEFLAIYLVSALFGGITQQTWSLIQGSATPCLGASGAVTTMLILCALHYPRKIIFFWFFPMPIWLFAILSIARDMYGMLAGDTQVAVMVHLAGAVFAVGYYKYQRSIVEILSGLIFWRRPRARARLKAYRPPIDEEEAVAVSATTSPPAAAVDEHLEAKLDAVLEKIAKTGKESLTPAEQEILQQAAEMYKKKRT